MTRTEARLRTVRPDGTPVYRHPTRPGALPVQVTRIDFEVDHPHAPPDHRHAHDFLVLVYIERGGGTIALGGQDTPLHDGDVHAIPPGQAIGSATLTDLHHSRAWSVAFTPDAVPSLASVSRPSPGRTTRSSRCSRSRRRPPGPVPTSRTPNAPAGPGG